MRDGPTDEEMTMMALLANAINKDMLDVLPGTWHGHQRLIITAVIEEEDRVNYLPLAVMLKQSDMPAVKMAQMQEAAPAAVLIVPPTKGKPQA